MRKNPPVVFISYAHEGDLSSQVKELADWLTDKGVQVITDHPYVNRPPENGWRAWMQHSVEDADMVLIVCTEHYKKLFERRQQNIEGGLGVTWESAIITADIYHSRFNNTRFYPILPDNGSHEHVPIVLQDWHNDHRFSSGNDRILSLITEDVVIPSPSAFPQEIGLANSESNKSNDVHMSSGFYGERRKEVLIDLLGNWKTRGPVTSIIQGFPGTGKSQLAGEVASHFYQAMPFFEPPVESDSPTHDVLIEIATSLDEEGFPEITREFDKGNTGDPFRALYQIIRRAPILIVIDEFQRIFEGKSTTPPVSWRRFIEKVNNSPNLKGRLILISNRQVGEDRWCESCKLVVLRGLSDIEAGKFLNNLLESKGIADKVPSDRLKEVGHRLGGNPRAIKTLAAGLVSDSLDELMSFYPDASEVGDVSVDPLLLEKFERGVIERTLSYVDRDLLKLMRYISVHRRPFDKSAILEYDGNELDAASLRRQLIDRFLLSNSVLGDDLHPLAREVSVTRLAEQQDEWIRAHNAAANYYLSRFGISRKKGVKNITSSYAELRHHLHQSGRISELGEVSERIVKFALSNIDKPAQSKVPESTETIDERIALLSVLPKKHLPKGLEFHLALCLKHRNVDDDYKRALFHIRNAVGPHAYYAAWLLLVDLEYELNGVEAMKRAQRKAVKCLKGGQNSFSIYHRCSHILSKENKVDEAITLLMEGIETPGVTCLSPLISLCADYMQKSGKSPDAIKLIENYLDKDLPEPAILYKRCADLMVSNGQDDVAVALLKRAIDKPGMTKVYSIYLMCSDILEKYGRTDEAMSLLKEGLVNSNVKDPVELYRKMSEILIKRGQSEEAIRIVGNGLESRSIKDPEKIYIYFSELLTKLGREDEASAMLRRLISTTSSPSSFLYLSCAKTLFHMRNLDEAIEILKEGISRAKLKERQQLIRMCGDLLYRKGKVTESVDVLEQGIEDPTVDNKYALFRLYADILVKENKLEEAIEVLKSGIKAPAVENKSVLIQTCAKLLERNGRRDEAVSLLKDVMAQPGITGLAPLYQICAKMMARGGESNGAIQLLKDAIKGPKIGNLVSLYQLCAELMLKGGQTVEAKAILLEGMKVFPKDGSLDRYYKKMIR